MSQQNNQSAKQKPVRQGLFYQPTSPDEKPYLIGSKCSACGYVAFPKRPVCPICIREGTMNEIALSTRGRINTFTISRVASIGFKAPYIQAYVDLRRGQGYFL